MTAFVQIIEYSSSRLDEIRALAERRRTSASGSPDAPVRVTVTADRKKPGRYMTIVEFTSYEAAMRNSASRETAAFASEMARLCDGPPVFHDLDVLESLVIAPEQRVESAAADPARS